MKKYFFVLVLLFSSSAFSLSIDIQWNKNFTKQLSIDCEDNIECSILFPSKTIISEKICSDCFSTDLNSSFIFQAIGTSVQAHSVTDDKEFFNFLKNENFISINFETPFDLISIDSRMSRRLRYRSVCLDGSVDPILFFEKNINQALGRARYVFCGENVHDLDIFSIDINDQFFNDLQLH